MIKKTYYKTKDYTKVTFALHAEGAKKVELFGLNNDWKKPIALAKKKDGIFSVDVNIAKNTEHEFKYLVDKNEWLNEPEADGQKPNAFGGTNSLITL